MRITWVGTATCLVEHAGFTVLTDPNFLHRGQRAWLGKGLWSTRLTEPALRVDQLPPLDAVVLSHLHGDHWDRVAQRALDHDLPVVTNRHAAVRLRRKGFHRAVALDTWETHELVKGGSLRITAVPGRHAPGAVQAALPPVMGSVWEFPDGQQLYVTGDTLVIPDLDQVQARFPSLDVGLWHLGGTRVLGVKVTMDGRDGADLLERVRVATCVPVHHGDYGVFADPLQTFLDEVARRGLTGVRTIDRGETLDL